MWFFTFIWKNLFRRPLRSILTLFAISIAICAFVALVGVANGFQLSFMQLYENAEVDLIVVKGTEGQRLNSGMPETISDKIFAIPGVKDVYPGLTHPMTIGDQMVMFNGLVPETKVFEQFKVVKGVTLKKRADTKKKRDPKSPYPVLLGELVARNLKKDIGDKIRPYGEDDPLALEVVGIYRSNNVYSNGFLVIALKDFQEMELREGIITGASVTVEKGTTSEDMMRIRRAIEKLGSGINAMPIGEHVETVAEIRMAKGMAWVTSMIALLIGTFGVMNTMIMSVHERTREIGMLRAVGWRGRRVVYMILFEAVVLSVIGAVIGVIFAIGLVKILTVLPQSAGFVSGEISPMLILGGFGIAILLGLVGGSLPALRAARLLPTEALRYE